MITKEELQHLAKLAKLKLSDKELNKLTPQLDSILEFVSQLNEVNTKGVAETHQTTGLENVYREDEIEPCEIEKELIQCSPHEIKSNSIVVPRIL